jgi:hypothetical protein
LNKGRGGNIPFLIIVQKKVKPRERAGENEKGKGKGFYFIHSSRLHDAKKMR